jgi:hypothetical protein
MSDKVFTNVNDDVLIRWIGAATRRITFVAPGVSEAVAKALVAQLELIPPANVNIVLDVDPEICRLGYGQIQGLEQIKAAAEKKGMLLLHQPGIRLGLLIADDSSLIYSPTPLLIEAGSKTPDKPNGICLSNQNLPTIEQACGIGGDVMHREVGLDPAKTPDIKKVKEDLERNPPKKFDVSRAERVFNSRIQYVEFTFEEYRLSQKTVPIPPSLMGITENRELLTRWKNNFRLFSDGAEYKFTRKVKGPDGKVVEETLSEKILEDEKKTLLKDFLIAVPAFGSVILRSRREEFDKRIVTFKERVGAFKEGVTKQIEDSLKKAKQSLIEQLIPHVVQHPPPEWRKTMIGDKLTKAEAGERLDEELTSLFSAVDRIFNPNIKVILKDVSYETLSQPVFMSALKKAFPAAVFRTLFKEYDAAPETAEHRFGSE